MARKILVIAILLLIGGCSSYRNSYPEQAESYTQHYANFDLKIDWGIKYSEAGTVIEGVVRNVRYFEMTGIEIWVKALDSNGKATGRSASFLMPGTLRRDEAAPFALALPLRAVPGTVLQFTYRYRANEDDHLGDFWMQSFNALVPGK